VITLKFTNFLGPVGHGQVACLFYIARTDESVGDLSVLCDAACDTVYLGEPTPGD
jgi:hypothetical protein